MTVRILQGDCRDVLKTLPDESVHCVVTSPPYFGLRDYGVTGQMGLEKTLGAFVEEMTSVFTDVRRVLRADGTLWLNLGDSYAAQQGNGFNTNAYKGGRNRVQDMQAERGDIVVDTGLPAKNLLGVPWRVALSLQKAGWWLRQDIIWAKPNSMPESVSDRCTKAHEYIFLLSKKDRYYFDSEAIAEKSETFGRQNINGLSPKSLAGQEMGHFSKSTGLVDPYAYEHRNKRSVWTVPTQPFKGSHFATFPPDLIKPCILAGCPAGGTVLDPFGGAGTTGLVADRHGRDAILIEINPEYAEMARKRIFNDAPLFAEVS
jgi:DNA modification methylase